MHHFDYGTEYVSRLLSDSLDRNYFRKKYYCVSEGVLSRQYSRFCLGLYDYNLNYKFLISF